MYNILIKKAIVCFLLEIQIKDMSSLDKRH